VGVQTLTPKQLDTLEFIWSYSLVHGYSPTLQEIGDKFEVSKVTVFECVENLLSKGYIFRRSGVSRGIRVMRSPPTVEQQFGKKLNPIPVVGRINARQEEVEWNPV